MGNVVEFSKCKKKPKKNKASPANTDINGVFTKIIISGLIIGAAYSLVKRALNNNNHEE